MKMLDEVEKIEKKKLIDDNFWSSFCSALVNGIFAGVTIGKGSNPYIGCGVGSLTAIFVLSLMIILEKLEQIRERMGA